MKEEHNGNSAPVTRGISYSPRTEDEKIVVTYEKQGDEGDTIIFTGAMKLKMSGHPEEGVEKLIIHHYQASLPLHYSKLLANDNDNKIIIKNGELTLNLDDETVEITGSVEEPVLIQRDLSEDVVDRSVLLIELHESVDTSHAFPATPEPTITQEAAFSSDPPVSPYPSVTPDPYAPAPDSAGNENNELAAGDAGAGNTMGEDERDAAHSPMQGERDGEHTGQESLYMDHGDNFVPAPEAKTGISPGIFAGALLLAALLGAFLSLLFTGGRKKPRKTESVKTESIPDVIPHSDPDYIEETSSTELFARQQGDLTISCGKCQDIGKRSSQQDSFLLRPISGGVMGVVADGMGGLKDGDVVSRKIVNTIDEACSSFSAEQLRGNLMAVIARVNDEVNRMLGPNELYKCGSTIVAVLAEPHEFQWISVGDSRVYLYRGGLLLQLNREHNYEADLRLRAVNHQGSFQEAKGNPKRKSVSSFIGMGTLRYVDEAQRPTRSLKGDRILICSDGVFNTLPEQHIEKILEENPEPNAAAEKLKAAVLQANNPHQDNFTAVIIAYE